jgi:hypothetical protein
MAMTNKLSLMVAAVLSVLACTDDLGWADEVASTSDTSDSTSSDVDREPAQLQVQAPSADESVPVAYCVADCGSGAPDVSLNAGVCTAVDRNCAAGQQGYVTGGGTTLYCPACRCTEGQIRWIPRSACCCDYSNEWSPVARKRLDMEVCVNGYWVYAGYECSGQICEGICPL